MLCVFGLTTGQDFDGVDLGQSQETAGHCRLQDKEEKDQRPSQKQSDQDHDSLAAGPRTCETRLANDLTDEATALACVKETLDR